MIGLYEEIDKFLKVSLWELKGTVILGFRRLQIILCCPICVSDTTLTNLWRTHNC